MPRTKEDNGYMKNYMKNRRIIARLSSYESLHLRQIVDYKLWKQWFNEKAGDKYKPCSVSPELAFDLMVNRCFYCGDFATTLDRLDSSLEHTPENCVGCCEFCNTSKKASDPISFVLRCVYRRTFEYFGDDDIWDENLILPSYSVYKANVECQKRPFELTREQFKNLCTSSCHYCKRCPEFVGIDKIVPDDGYILNNCVSCCGNCNADKWDRSLEEFTLRDERITQRYLSGYFDDIPIISKNTSHFKNKLGGSTQNVYQYTTNDKFIAMYNSTREASRNTNICQSSISNCVNMKAKNKRKTAGGFKWYSYKL